MIHKYLFPLCLLLSIDAHAEGPWRYQMRGFLSTRLSSYTKNTAQNYGQLTRAQFEQSTEFTSNLVALNQLRWISNSLVSDLSTKTTSHKKDSFDTYLGENYLKYKGDNSVLQLGYQEVVWGEAFGFNYADIINPKDQRETFYSDAAETRLPLLLANGKVFFSSGDLSGSIQLLASPEPRFSKTLPLEIYAGDLIPQATLSVIKEKSPQIFDEYESGAKIAMSYAGFDTSLFTYSYLSRDPHYSLVSATLTSLTVKEEHSRIRSSGVSLAKTLFDFVFRTDIVQTQDKMINYISPLGQLLSYPVKTLNTLVSIDSPTYNDYSGVLIFAKSTIDEAMPNSFREESEQYMIAKISKNLGRDKSFEFSYTHEFEHTGQSIQSFVNWPINSTTDLKLGGEFYFGKDESNLRKFQKISSVFLSLKNYFQL